MKHTTSSTRTRTRLRRTALAGLSALSAGVLVSMSATGASADTGPTEEQLLSQCGKADLCRFTPNALIPGVGPEHNVGPTIINCGGNVTRTWSWSETVSQSTNASVSASLASALWEPISVSATATFGKSFEKSHTTSETLTQNMDPFTMAWTTRATGLQTIVGTWELHFPNRFFGHYIWYDNGYESKVEDPNGGFIALHYKAMSDAEILRHCPGEKPPALRQGWDRTTYIKGAQVPTGTANGWVGVARRGIASGDGHSSG